MTVRTVITCDNCKREEPFAEHARIVAVELRRGNQPDEAMKEIGFPDASFDLCGFCTAKLRQALVEARPS